MNQRRAKTGLLYLVAWFTVTIFSLPLLVMVSGSLKSSEQLTRDPYSLWPAGWNWSNYPEALASMPFFGLPVQYTVTLYWMCDRYYVVMCVGRLWTVTCRLVGSSVDVWTGHCHDVASLAYHDDSPICIDQ